MNVYLIIEDNEQFCIKANTMKDAIDICLKSYLEDEDIEFNKDADLDKLSEAQWYYDEILQSCSLAGKLKN